MKVRLAGFTLEIDQPRAQVSIEQFVRQVANRIPDELEGEGDPLKPMVWAHSLKSREEAGENLTMDQRKAWRDALVSVNTGPRQEFGAGAAIPLDVLPASMRAEIERERAGLPSIPREVMPHGMRRVAVNDGPASRGDQQDAA